MWAASSRPGDDPMRLVVAGKGGAGKSVVAGTLARILARRGQPVLAIDSDPMPGLSVSLGMGLLIEPPLEDACERDENGRWRLKKGIGPARAVRRFSIPGPDGVRLLHFGKAGSQGLSPLMGSLNALYQVVHRLAAERVLRDWTIVGDVPAGPRHAAFDWFPYAKTVLVVVEPTWQSVLTARRIGRISSSRRGVVSLFVGNKVQSDGEQGRLEERLGAPLYALLPLDRAVADSDRLGVASLDHDPGSPFVGAVERLAARLRRR